MAGTPEFAVMWVTRNKIKKYAFTGNLFMKAIFKIILGFI